MLFCSCCCPSYKMLVTVLKCLMAELPSFYKIHSIGWLTSTSIVILSNRANNFAYYHINLALRFFRRKTLKKLGYCIYASRIKTRTNYVQEKIQFQWKTMDKKLFFSEQHLPSFYTNREEKCVNFWVYPVIDP